MITIDGQDYNVFEIIRTIRFDDPKDGDTAIKKKFDEWKQSNDSEVNNGGSLDSFPVKLKGKYAEIEWILSDKKARNAEAKDMIEKQGKIIKDCLCPILSSRSELSTVTPGMASKIAALFRLSSANCMEYLRSGGIVISKPEKKDDLLKKTFILPVVEKAIASNISAFNNWAAENNVPKIDDLYDFVSNVSGKPKSVCQQMSCAGLKDISDNCLKSYAGDNTPKGHLYRDLASQAATQVFDGQSSRDRYDNTLKLHKLSALFGVLLVTPEELLLEPIFADNAIERIRIFFPDYETALALYNHKARLLKNPYEPTVSVHSMSCPVCGSSLHTYEEVK